MPPAPQQPSFIHARAAQIQAVAHYPLAKETFIRLRDQLAAYCGVHLDTTRQHILEQAVAYRMQAIQCDLTDYERRMQFEREELHYLSELVVNHETYFFRNQPHTRALCEVLLPELHRRKPPGEPIRIWSAGCATGEEAYSLAITALEALPKGQRPVEVWATDLSEAALVTARAATYAGRSLTNVAPDMLENYFEPAGPAYRVCDQVRDLVRFEKVNLIEPLPLAARNIDIVFCQNVIIYFELATSHAFLHNLYEMLPNGGMLCLGFSEALWNIFDGFHTREVLGAYVYYKEALPPKQTTALLGTSTSIDRREIALSSTSVPQPQRVIRAMARARAVLPTAAPQPSAAVQVLVVAARTHADRGEIELALDTAKEATKCDPMHDEAALLLGVLFGRRGAWDAAVRQLERARYLNSASPLVSFQLAEAYRHGDRTQAAQREYRNTLVKLQAYPPDIMIHGVAVGWLREACQRQIIQAQQGGKEKGR